MPSVHVRRGASCVAFFMALSSASFAQEGMPPPEVGVVTVAAEDVSVSALLPGRIAPTRIAEVRARVDGIVESRVFAQGAEVEEGDVLFRIDPATYEVAVEAAQAGVDRAQAVLLNARSTEERQRTLYDRNASSQSQYDTARADMLQAQADVAAAEAQLKSAKISLGYTEITAPISGYVGRANITEGALVQSSGAEILTTIQDLDVVYADIQQPVSELLRLRHSLEAGEVQEVEPGVAQVRLMLDDGSVFPHAGRLLFSEASVDPTSGQVTLRAEFPNEERDLLPGMFVRVSVEQGVEKGVIAVPSQAIQRMGAAETAVYVVSADGKVQTRSVTTGRSVDTRTVITNGLNAGDRVVVDGLQKIGPGAAVSAVAWTPDEGDAEGGPELAATQSSAR